MASSTSPTPAGRVAGDRPGHNESPAGRLHGEDGFETTPARARRAAFSSATLAGMFYAVSADTGKSALDRFDAGGSPIHASANSTSRPDLDRIALRPPMRQRYLPALNAVTGKQIWNAKAGDRVNGVPGGFQLGWAAWCSFPGAIRSFAVEGDGRQGRIFRGSGRGLSWVDRRLR